MLIIVKFSRDVLDAGNDRFHSFMPASGIGPWVGWLHFLQGGMRRMQTWKCIFPDRDIPGAEEKAQKERLRIGN